MEERKVERDAVTLEAKELEDKFSKLPEKIDISDTAEYQEITKQIAEKEKLLKSMEDTSEYRKALKEEEQELREELFGCESKILMANTEAEEKRLEGLKEKRTDMVQQQAGAEKVLYLLTELEKAKNEELSDQINQRFKLVQWQLFETAKMATINQPAYLWLTENLSLQQLATREIGSWVELIFARVYRKLPEYQFQSGWMTVNPWILKTRKRFLIWLTVS